MQPMHNVHPSKRHERSSHSSGSLHNLYDNEPQTNQFSMNQQHHSPSSRGQYQQHPGSTGKITPAHSRSIPRNNNNNNNNNNYHVPQQTSITQSSSFTEAHSNNPQKNMTLQSLKSSQSIPSPLIHRNNNHNNPKSKSTMYANSNPMSGLQHPSIGKIIENKNKNNKNNNDPNLFTLHGILRIMKQQDPNYQMVTLGMDLTQLGGLDLNCPEPEIHHTFLSPWLDKWDDSNKFITPNCYKLKHNEHPPIKFIKRYKETTLFYIFYSCVNDKMQVIAAKELYQRHWVYHKTLQIWLKSPSNSTSNKQINKQTNKKDKKNGGDNDNKIDDKKNDLNQDKAITFMKNVSVQQIEYFDVESWAIKKHFYSKFPIDWNKERKKLLHEHQLNYFYKACTDSYPKSNRHQH